MKQQNKTADERRFNADKRGDKTIIATNNLYHQRSSVLYPHKSAVSTR
jgi:hypothetical protein